MDRGDAYARLMRGEVVQIGKHLWVQCQNCGKLIRVNKPVLGALHYCLPDYGSTD